MVYRNRNRNRAQDFFAGLERLAGESSSRSRAGASDMSDFRSQPSDEGSSSSQRSGSVCGDEVQRLVAHISRMFMNEECSDVTLVVEGCHFPAHKVILAARSIYFKAMFFGGMRESKEKVIELQETPVQAFRVLLEYIYTGRMVLKEMKTDLVFDILGLVHKYGFTELEHNVSEYLKGICKPENVCHIFCASEMYSLRDLESFCLDFMDYHAAEIVKQPSFRELPAHALEEVIARDSFCAPEIEIFKAVKQWMETNPGDTNPSIQQMMRHIRLSLIKLDDLLNLIRPSGLIPPDILLDAINDQTRCKNSDLVYRGFQLPNVNIATSAFGVKIIAGEIPKYYEFETTVRDNNLVVLKHSILEKDPGIIIELSRPSIINHIRFQLYDKKPGCVHSYFVEVSMDKLDWVRVVDYTKYICRSKQNLHFYKRVVKFIRICGTSSTASKLFEISNLEAMFTTEPVDIDPITKLIIPKQNVATIENGADVSEGVSRSRNVLINGDTQNYDWDNGYTCHQLGSGNIIIHLAQPYMIDSMGLLLWDCDDRQYSYHIEVSTDQTNWHKVTGETEVSSWRRLTIERQPVNFIKIVGTYNSANEVFHIVHFECPSIEDFPTRSNASVARQFAGIGEQAFPPNRQDQGIERVALEQPD